MEGVVSRDTMLRGARWFAALTVAGLGILVVAGGGGTWEVMRGMSGGFIALAALSALLDLAIGAGRYQIFLRRIRPDSPFSLPLRADLANRFAGALTPSQTGGGPAQVYILARGGIPVVEALPFLAINFLSTMAFFLVAGGGTAWLLRDAFSTRSIDLLVRYGFGAFLVMGGLVFVSLLRPDLIHRGCGLLVERVRGDSRFAAATRRLGAWVVDNLDRYRETCVRFVRREPLLLWWSFLLTALLYANKFTLGYLVMRGLGVDAPYLEVFAVQTLLQFILFVAPSPGGSGIAELTTAALMARFLQADMLAVFTAIFRAFLLYGPAALGCLVLVHALRPARAK